ncbi:MAG: hypothetical protein LWX56_05640 [Ignavibacteria bacterium]|nr:hypothetical protein [Ignavibacteria bacterium]
MRSSTSRVYTITGKLLFVFALLNLLMVNSCVVPSIRFVNGSDKKVFVYAYFSDSKQIRVPQGRLESVMPNSTRSIYINRSITFPPKDFRYLIVVVTDTRYDKGSEPDTISEHLLGVQIVSSHAVSFDMEFYYP